MIRWIFLILLSVNFIALSGHSALTFKGIKYDANKRAALDQRRAALTSKATHKRMTRIHTAMSSENYDRALSMLKKLEKSTKARPFEKGPGHADLWIFVFQQR